MRSIANLLFASYKRTFQLGMGRARVKCVGRIVEQNRILKKCTNKQSRKISNEIKWMSRIQAYKVAKQEGTTVATTLAAKVHKQGALGTSSQATLH